MLSKKKVCYCCVFQNGSAERQSSESFCISLCGTQSEVANLAEVSCTTVYAIRKRMDDGESVNRCADSGQTTVVDRDSWRDVIRSSPSRDTHLRARHSHFVFRTKKGRNLHLIISLGVIFKYTTITYLFLQWHSHRASGGLNKCRIKPANNQKCNKKFCSIFSAYPVYLFEILITEYIQQREARSHHF